LNPNPKIADYTHFDGTDEYDRELNADLVRELKEIRKSINLLWSVAPWNVTNGISPITIANAGTYTLPPGSGEICITSHTAGHTAKYLVGNSSVTLMGQTSFGFFVVGAPAGGQFGLAYDGTSAYKFTNNVGSSQTVVILALKTRDVS
jgi:hypothetical protein